MALLLMTPLPKLWAMPFTSAGHMLGWQEVLWVQQQGVGRVCRELVAMLRGRGLRVQSWQCTSMPLLKRCSSSRNSAIKHQQD